MKLRTKITLSMLGLVVVSLLVIGMVTIWFFAELNISYHTERLERKERAIKADMAYLTKEVQYQESTDVVVKEFEQELLRLASVHQMVINVFNTTGELLVAAQPDSIYSAYVDKRVPDAALADLRRLDRIVLPEAVNGEKYLSDYTNLYNNQGDRIAILNLPYLQDSTIDDDDLADFLSSIGLVYLFIFLGGAALTVVLSNSITKNLSALSERMTKVDLDHDNEPFDWHSDDEIGTLIATYNAMLAKLDESRQRLAKTERESAWREMAKQVAHEIKNPLTPIKLSVQHLQATAAYDDPEWRKKFSSTMQTIIMQIDSLSRIATEFSDFAQMPKNQAQQVDVNRIVAAAVDLFTDAAIELKLEIHPKPLMVSIDPEQFGRALNNLIKNAKQAVAEVEAPLVNVRVYSENQRAYVVVSDNGRGIEPSIQDKIFLPNFTTKNSGMGLGLAICSQIIEQAQGTITFESSAEIGTHFKVSLPLISG